MVNSTWQRVWGTLLVLACGAFARADDIFGNRTATPTRLLGVWEATCVTESSSRYGFNSTPIESDALRLCFSKVDLEVVEQGHKSGTREFYVAPPTGESVPTQALYYAVNKGDGVFRQVPVSLTRVPVLMRDRLVEFDTLSMTLSTSDDLFSHAYVPERPQVTRMVYFRKVRTDLTERTLPIDEAEQLFPEEICGRWQAYSQNDPLELMLDGKRLVFSSHRGARTRSYDYVPDGGRSTLFLPLDGDENLFVGLHAKHSADDRTLEIRLVPKVSRWLEEILPEAARGQPKLVFHLSE